jgi:DNA-binding GntR family transcriptional regulator
MPSYVPAYRRVADEIGEKIRTGQLKPGDRLPSTRQLREQYEVSEMVIRQAMMILRERRLVEGVPGVGVFVAGDSQE